MRNIQIKDLMVPLTEYAVVKDDATLYDVVLALEEAQRRFDQNRYTHRAVLVEDKTGRVIGKVSQLDLLKGLETGYSRIGDLSGVTRSGLNPDFIRSLIKQYSLWQDPLDQICGKAAHIKVRDIMHTPEEGEYVDQEDTLDKGIHQLVMGRKQSLLVTKDGRIVGVLRLVDVFSEVCKVIKVCRI